MSKKELDVSWFVVLVCVLSLSYICYHHFKTKPEKTNRYIDQITLNGVFRAYEDGTILKMS